MDNLCNCYNLLGLTKAENNTEQLKLKLKDAESSMTHLDSTHHDMKMAIDAKDSQLAVLKIRLKEADDEVQKKREAIDKIQQERDRFYKRKYIKDFIRQTSFVVILSLIEIQPINQFYIVFIIEFYSIIIILLMHMVKL